MHDLRLALTAMASVSMNRGWIEVANNNSRALRKSENREAHQLSLLEGARELQTVLDILIENGRIDNESRRPLSVVHRSHLQLRLHGQ